MEKDQPKKEPFAFITCGEERYEARQDNVSVYTHLARYAMYDHVFVEVEEGGEQQMGVYIWRHSPGYTDMVREAVNAQAPIHANIPEPSQFDQDRYSESVLRDLKELDSFPDEWESETDK